MARIRLPITFVIKGDPIGGETLCTSAGARVLVLTSCWAQAGIELRSAFVGGERRDQILVAESAVLAGEAAELSSRLLELREVSVLDERRRLLYDHLQRLQELALSSGVELAFAGVEEAILILDPASPETLPRL